MKENNRIDADALAPNLYKAMLRLNAEASHVTFDPKLTELIKVRVSQINGCAYCLDMHTKDARAIGETEMRLYVLAAWREAPFYSERERAALAFAEAVTLLPNGPVSDEVYDAAAACFTPEELAILLWQIIVINAWNRVAVPTHMEPGHYEPSKGT